MRPLLVLALLLFMTATSSAQTKLQILDPDTKPRRMLYDFELAEAQKLFDARREKVAALKTPADIQARQRDLRQKFIEAIGGFPEKTPLNPQVVGTLKGDGFRVEKVIYESRPNHQITGNLYIPDGKGPFPGVLVPCGHSDNGKANDSYQRISILLAKNGFAVLCYDPIGQGERRQLLEESAPKAAIKGGTNEHTLIGVGALLVGQSTSGYRIWDGIRTIDYLTSRPEVDATRIGCTGNSGGGTMTSYLMALDERIGCAAPSCYITSLERLFATLGPQDAEQNVTGQVAFGMEHADFLTMRAPVPALVGIASQDFFDTQGSWTTFREATKIFGALGHPERIAIHEYNDKHGYSKPRREATVRWMRRWLLHIDDAPTEEKAATFKDAELQCTRSGQVLADFKGVSSFDLNRREAKKFEAERAIFVQRDAREQMGTIRLLLGVPAEVPAAKELSRTKLGDGNGTDKVVFESEKGILLPGLHFKQAAPAKTVLCFPDEGLPKDGLLPEEFAGKHGRMGMDVWMFDLRGLGETAAGSRAGLFGSDFKETYVGLHIGRPLLGQRTFDVLSLLKAIGAEKAELVGDGVAGPIVLHAAALDERVKYVATRNAITSWTKDVVERPTARDQLTNAVPGVLKHYDLPDLVRVLRDRNVQVASQTQQP